MKFEDLKPGVEVEGLGKVVDPKIIIFYEDKYGVVHWASKTRLIDKEQIEPDKVIPPDGAAVWVSSDGSIWTGRVSTGKMNQKGELLCYDHNLKDYPWPHWQTEKPQ